jgi:hypothetical protein
MRALLVIFTALNCVAGFVALDGVLEKSISREGYCPILL